MTYRSSNRGPLALTVSIALLGAASPIKVSAGGPCGLGDDCDDGNPCTDDVCDAGVCVHDFNNAPCDDGCACTLDDVCDVGVCSGMLDPGCDKCVDDSDCNDGDPCTVNTCAFGACPLGGVCVITPACDDDNPCTDDICNSDGLCSYVANFDSASMCCNPNNGAISVIECAQTHCYDPICLPTGCTCCDRPDGDPCAEPIVVPAASHRGVVVMTLLVVAVGALTIRRAPSHGGRSATRCGALSPTPRNTSFPRAPRHR